MPWILPLLQKAVQNNVSLCILSLKANLKILAVWLPIVMQWVLCNVSSAKCHKKGIAQSHVLLIQACQLEVPIAPCQQNPAQSLPQLYYKDKYLMYYCNLFWNQRRLKTFSNCKEMLLFGDWLEGRQISFHCVTFQCNIQFKKEIKTCAAICILFWWRKWCFSVIFISKLTVSLQKSCSTGRPFHNWVCTEKHDI